MRPGIVKQISAIFNCAFHEYEDEIETLHRIRQHDEYTYLHCLNVAQLSVSLGRRFGLTPDMLVDLGWAALLHDIGKLHVPTEILNKAHKFTPEELTVMQSHPLKALTAFADTHSVSFERLRRLAPAFEHHQRYDLKGYPYVKRKLTLHPFSRIIAITDTFDAMTTDRIYQRRVLPDVALKIMAQGFGTNFDPVVLQAFITSMGAYPVGSLVRLSSNELAVVTHYGERSALDRPTLWLLEGTPPRRRDLMDEKWKDLKILKSEFPEDHSVDVRRILDDAARGAA